MVRFLSADDRSAENSNRRPETTRGSQDVKITIVENGPIIFKTDGQVSFRMGTTNENKSGSVALCRCGQSSTKPFCDGAHRKAEFKAMGGEIDFTS
jgi:CDGSH-type Zn-finger protein